MTERASCNVGPTRAMRNGFFAPRASALIHSAPARVLPAPRPAMKSQTRQRASG